MEVGAVKQAFNNEIILLKKKLNQARTQIIHKLTRKAKTLTEKKAPEALKEKLKRKAESSVKEVLLLKKVKARDLGKFIVTHKEELNKYLNRPQVDNDKVCARLLLHKVLQDKYTFIRKRFSDVPIKDLFMSRQERLKLKKEEKEKSKNKKNKNKDKVTNAQGDWEVEDVGKSDNTNALGLGSVDDDDLAGDDSDMSLRGSDVSDGEQIEGSDVEFDQDDDVNVPQDDSVLDNDDNIGSNSEAESDDNASKKERLLKTDRKVETKHKSNIVGNKNIGLVTKKQKEIDIQTPKIDKVIENKFKIIEKEILKKQGKKQKVVNKNKNFNEKIINRKFKKDVSDEPKIENKIVDPFFITSTGENYMSVVEPREPDEVKEEHKQGNRKLRRAVMFGHVPKIKPRSNFRQNNNGYEKQGFEKQGYEKQNGNQRYNKFGDKPNDITRNNFNKQDSFKNNKINPRNNTLEEPKPEKLHPSWEAKKKQSGILPYKGKKIVFDE